MQGEQGSTERKAGMTNAMNGDGDQDYWRGEYEKRLYGITEKRLEAARVEIQGLRNATAARRAQGRAGEQSGVSGNEEGTEESGGLEAERSGEPGSVEVKRGRKLGLDGVGKPGAGGAEGLEVKRSGEPGAVEVKRGRKSEPGSVEVKRGRKFGGGKGYRAYWITGIQRRPEKFAKKKTRLNATTVTLYAQVRSLSSLAPGYPKTWKRILYDVAMSHYLLSPESFAIIEYIKEFYGLDRMQAINLPVIPAPVQIEAMMAVEDGWQPGWWKGSCLDQIYAAWGEELILNR